MIPGPSTMDLGGQETFKSVIKNNEVRERRVEVGHFRKIKPIHVIYYYETFPTWLLLFDALSCLSITIVGFKDYATFEQHWSEQSNDCLKLIQLILQSIGMDKFRFEQRGSRSPPQVETLILVSGSIKFLGGIDTISDHQPVLFILDRHFTSRLQGGRPSGVADLKHIVWLRLQHAWFGGPTNYISLVGVAGMQIDPGVTSLRRTIKDIFNAGERPSKVSDLQVAAMTGAKERSYYTLQDQIDINQLNLPVYHPTRFFQSGWGQRHLSLPELGSAFGFPRQYHYVLEPTEFKQPPYQLLVVLFEASVRAISLEPQSYTEQDPVVKLVIVDPKKDDDYLIEQEASWLPKLALWLPHSWVGESVNLQKVTKHDNAVVPSHLWDSRITSIFPTASSLLPALRTLCLIRSRRNIWIDFRNYMRAEYGQKWSLGLSYHRQVQGRKRHQGGEGLFSDTLTTVQLGTKYGSSICLVAKAAVDVIEKINDCDWWEWTKGSSLIFWRWNKDDIIIAREGMFPFIQTTLPTWKLKKPKKIKEPKFSLVIKILKTVVERNYLSPGTVRSWTDFFDVPKGDDDIRMVYNGTSCGLNQALWAPNFWLPFPRSAARVLDYNSYSADMDVGEMFHNFPLHELLQEYSGIDLSPFHKELNLDLEKSRSYRWTRTWMGARFSPYSCVRYYHLAEEFCRGNHLAESNVMGWDVILLNLPGHKDYDPRFARVRKWDTKYKRVAGDITTYVDDGRVTGADLEHAWAVIRQVNSRLQYFGIQVALRKVNPPKRTPGPWAGALFETSSTNITRSVTIEKWNKGKLLIENLWHQLDHVEWNTTLLSYKELEVVRGFLGHLSMTFESLVPYLKGFHLTLSSHLNKRDKEGWKYTDKSWRMYLYHKVEQGLLSDSEAERMEVGIPYSPIPPKTILPVKQLKDDVYALREFLSTPIPPKLEERNTRVQIVRYGFGDASGAGFGSTIETKDGLKYRIGVWGSDDDNESSNFKELENVVTTIEEEALSGNLKDSVLFFFTDNSTVEAALYKGNSSSKKLFDLVVRFRKLQFTCGTQVVVSHVSGKRMIAQGTDGVSRGTLHEGVGTGMEMLGFIPLHLNAFERHPPIKQWLISWMGPEVEFLEPTGWYTRGHDHDGGYVDERGFWRIKLRSGLFVWAPPPGAAEVALEELRKAVIKRQNSTHIFLCPRLITTEWMKQLHKTSDLVLSIPAGSDIAAWPSQMYEPLTIGFIFPLLPFKPWQRKSTPKMFYVERQLSSLFKGEGMASGDFLCKFLKEQRSFSSMPELLVRRMLYLTK